jgi:uncharacterized protein (TIGR03437 family)
MAILSFRRTKIILIFSAGAALLGAAAAYGQAIISTVAGGGFVNNAPALKSHLGGPQGVAVDGSGNVYVADSGRILKIDHSTGVLSAVAGQPTAISANDGPALSVRIFPTDIAFNSSGNILFLDSSMLRQLNLQQAAITTLAGKDGTNGSTGDGGSAAAALLNMPLQFCLDAAGNIYIAEQPGFVRRIDAQSHAITTIAGTGGTVFGGDNGPAKNATLLRPSGIAVDSSGNLYIADANDLRIRKINASTQIITTIAGTGHGPSGGDGGPALKASFGGLGDLAIDSQNNLYAIDGYRVRRITASTGVIATVAGGGTDGLGDGGQATQAEINLPASMALDSAGDLFIADTGDQRIRMVAAATGIITTIAGTSQNGDGGLAAGAVLSTPTGVAVDAAGNLYIAGGNFIRQVGQAGIINTFAGGGTSTADGIPAIAAQLNALSLAFDTSGNLIVGEPGLIRRIDTAGTITTIAGTGVQGFSGDGGPATSAQVRYVTSLAVDTSGNVLFADAGNQRLRKIDAGTGIMSTVAGNGQTAFSGLGQSAAQTGIGNVAGVAVDPSGNIYVGSINTAYLLKISSSGAVSIAGGNTGCSYIGDGGLAVNASICQPSSLALDSSGNLYVGDTTCYCVRQISAATGIIQTVAGNGSKGYTGDNGPALQAEMRSVASIALFGSTLYVADGVGDVVRAVTPDSPPAMPVAPNFSSITSSASYESGPIAPGELISFFGNYLGPVTAAYATLGSNGRVTNELGDVQVLFDGVPSPLIYVGAGQINAIAPYSVANGIHTITVKTPGGAVSTTDFSATVSAPAVFGYAIVNPDGSRNDVNHPAPVGSVVVMYGTGLGQTDPPAVDGALNPLTNFPSQVYPVTLSISRNPLFGTTLPMKSYYAAPAPGEVSGVCQINAMVPQGVASGENFIEISAGPNVSPAITFYVQ